MVPVAPLLAIGIKMLVLGYMADRPRVSLLCDWVGCACHVPATGALEFGSTITCLCGYRHGVTEIMLLIRYALKKRTNKTNNSISFRDVSSRKAY